MPKTNPNKVKRLVSVVVPMCNEEESIEILRDKLELLQQRLESQYELEFCLVDDGSTDRTWELMESAVPAGGSCVCRRHISNQGLGAAIRTGLQAASGFIVCTIDADCSYPPEDLSVLIELVESGNADVAIASPYHPQGGVIGVRAWRILLSRQCSRLYRLLGSVELYTYTSIFRAYRGTVAQQMQFKSNGFVSAVEMLFQAARLGYRIQEVPLVLRARQRGYSKIRIARTIWTHLGMLLSLAQMTTAERMKIRNTHAPQRLTLGHRAAGLNISPQLSKEDTPILMRGMSAKD